MREVKNVNILVEKPEGKSPLERTRFFEKTILKWIIQIRCGILD
jgi:hypothetical protein